MPIEQVLTKYVTGEEGEEVEGAEGEGAEGEGEKAEKAGASSAAKKPANPAVAGLQKAAGGSKPISPFLRAKPSNQATNKDTVRYI